jgi:GLPGLI family protein
MKKIVFTVIGLLAILSIQAQQKEGKVVYERTSQLNIRINDSHGGMENDIPRTRTDKFELSFGNNQALYKAAEAENENETMSTGEGMQVRMIVSGSDDVLFTNFETGKRVEKRELFDKSFIIDDSITKMKWKMTGETKTILGFPTMKATSTRITPRTMMTMDNGKMERKEIQDTSLIEAWFTSNIPVSAGPSDFQGQLPGLILEMNIGNGRQTFKAVSVSEKVDLSTIKEPTGKKRYSPEEFRKEREKMLEEMQKNNQGGGNRIIRMQ